MNLSRAGAHSRLPNLAPGEELIATERFAEALDRLPPIPWQMSLTTRRLVATYTNAWFGETHVTFPITGMASVEFTRGWSVHRIELGLAFVAHPLILTVPNAFPVLPLLPWSIAAVLFASSLRGRIQVTDITGKRFRHNLALWDSDRAGAFVDRIDQAIATHGHYSYAEPSPK